MYRTASQRQETLAEYQASGESVSQWCDHSEIHRTTLYRWLRLETKQKAEKAKAAKRESEVRVAEAAQVKWLPITMSSGLEQTGIAESIMNPNKIEPGTYTTVEIRVQIGEFTVITPDGFKRETLETVCKALQAIC